MELLFGHRQTLASASEPQDPCLFSRYEAELVSSNQRRYRCVVSRESDSWFSRPSRDVTAPGQEDMWTGRRWMGTQVGPEVRSQYVKGIFISSAFPMLLVPALPFLSNSVALLL